MTSDKNKSALELFEAMVEMDPAAWPDYLAQHCADTERSEKVRKMLSADARTEGFLDDDAKARFADLANGQPSNSERPKRVAHYDIIDCIGSGGMATVYRARRIDTDFEQTVALKLIAPNRQSPLWRQRFLQERQILATLQHPNIATLLDGGFTEDEQPYIAMEFVDGQPLTEYCDTHQLGIAERLRLLLAVCEAIRYAHSNLIVHRDLKPGNILVDGNGAPKLLDFGIAKILTDDGAEQTQTLLRVLTPDYAAPEQFTGEPVTTAVDIYALGGLLYELLVGRRPYADVTGSALDIEREIREHGAPSFAQALAMQSADERAEVASRRGLSARRLRSAVLGDLENIALTALRKEPERRYASAEAFAADIRRYLDGLPVAARPDTLGYRLGKFALRHRVGVPLAVVAIAALVGTSAVALQQAREAEKAAFVARLEAARANETRDFVTNLFEFASPDKSLGEQLTARQLLDLGAARIDEELAGQPALQADIALLLANTYHQLGLYDRAHELAQRSSSAARASDDVARVFNAELARARALRQRGALDDAATVLATAEALLNAAMVAERGALMVEYGELRREQADFETARMSFREALALAQSRLAPATEIANVLYRQGTLEFSAGDSAKGLELLREAAEALASSQQTNTTVYASIRHDVGVMLIQRGDLAEAREVLEDVRITRLRLLGAEHPDVAGTLKEIAGIARQQGAHDEAERLYLDALAINEAMLGTEHPETANTLNSLAVLYRGLGDDERALAFGQRALDGATKVYGPNHPTVGLMTVNVGSMQRMLGHFDAALANTHRGLSILTGVLGEEHHLVGVAYNAVAGVQHDQRDYAAAAANYEKAVTIFEATAGDNHPHLVSILSGLATLLVDTNRLGEAKPLYERAATIAAAALPDEHPNVARIQLGRARIAALELRCDEARSLYDTYQPIVAAAPGTAMPYSAAAVLGTCR